MIPEIIAQEIASIAGVTMVGVSGIVALTLIVCARILKQSHKEKNE